MTAGPEHARLARMGNMIMGAWLIFSAFLWLHTPQQFGNAIAVGGLCFGTATVATIVPPVRVVNTVLALWLLVSSFALPSASLATVWNHVFVSLAVLILSLASWQTKAAPRSPRPT